MRTPLLVAALAFGLDYDGPTLERAPRFSVDTTLTIASLLAADSALAADVARRGAAAVLEACEPDAAVLFTGQPIMRADSARAVFMARYGAPADYRWRPLHAIASADGLLGCTVGLSTFRDGRDSVPMEHVGTYETCWRRTGAGRWRIAGQQRNDSPPQSPSIENARRTRWPHSSTVSLPGDALKEALDTDAEFARVAAEPAGPGPAFVRFAADDGMGLGGTMFQYGRREIGAVFDDYPADRYIAWQPDRRFGAASGGLAFTVGHSDHLPRDDKPGARRYGKFLTIWRQRADGRWEYVFDLGSPRVAGKSAGS